MSRIKSAWELAMEKTKDIEVDEAKFRESTLEKEGMALAGSFLNSADMSQDELSSRYSSYSAQDVPAVKKGIVNTVFSNLGLPADNLYEMRFERIVALVVLISPEGSPAVDAIRQIGDLFSQYTQHRTDFVQRMQDQIRQAMEEDPEHTNSAQYAQVIQQNLKKLDTQYQGALDSAKESLRAALES